MHTPSWPRDLRCVLVLLVITLAGIAHADEQLEFFEAKIRPVLVAKCYKCHSAEAMAAGKLQGGLMLDNRDGTRQGGDSGAAVVPGELKKSLLMSAIRYEDFEMPPKGKLPDEVIADFAKWIEMGAPDPREGEATVSEEVDLEQGREFWSFQPVVEPDLKRVGKGESPIDYLVSAEREKQGLRPVPEATPERLVRRLYFDLIGLPPEPAELDQWVTRLDSRDAGSRGAALEEFVDTLLASPSFGERWGRHWLDVARYAESNGNSRNATFPHAWRYRDYVIDSFNDDTPYDQFLLEQLAGDLLPSESPEEANRQMVATGFLALGSKPVIRGKASGFIPDIVADQIEVTSRSVLGLTVACARCHDHKFDPIPTADYYGLAGIFASSETLYGGGGNSMGGAPATGLHTLLDKDPAKTKAYRKWKQESEAVDQQLKEINGQIKKLTPRRKKGKPADKLSPEAADKIKQLAAEQRELSAKKKQLQANKIDPPGSAMGMREADRVSEVPIYVRGETAKGKPISRQLLSVMSSAGKYDFPSDQSGRLQLAQWLADETNPLTARVMVNRIWLHLFGEGIVRTPDNFGFNGERPTHPELLDHLAATFMADGWSVKRLIRRLVLTETYRLSDAYDEANYASDPDNIYHWRHSRRRLEAEAIRDSILAASGTLDRESPQGSVVTPHGGKLIQDALTPDKIHQPSDHRSVYLPILRNGLPESLEIFDFADPSLVVGRRSVTTVPAQDLYLLNNPFVVEKSRAFAQRLEDSTSGVVEQIREAYRIALSREPTSTEVARAKEFVELASQNGSAAEDSMSGLAGFCQALFVSAEFRHLR